MPEFSVSECRGDWANGTAGAPSLLSRKFVVRYFPEESDGRSCVRKFPRIYACLTKGEQPLAGSGRIFTLESIVERQ